MFAINDRCNCPLHLLVDNIHCQGSSRALLQILNRLGITSSRNVLDYHKNAITLSTLHSMEDQMARTSFAFTSIDICHAMFAINNRCNCPLHLLLLDNIQCQGGSQALLQILNRLGITSSCNVLDYHKNAIILFNLHSMEDQMARTPFAFTSIDNIDKGAPHTPATADGKPRIVRGTSYQVVFPQPHTTNILAMISFLVVLQSFNIMVPEILQPR